MPVHAQKGYWRAYLIHVQEARGTFPQEGVLLGVLIVHRLGRS